MKIAIGFVLFIFFSITIIVALLRIPSVNYWATQKATNYSNDLLGYPIEIERIQIDWYDHIILHHIVIRDRENNSMIYLGEGHIDIIFRKLLKGELRIENVTVKNGGVDLYNFKDNQININEFVETLSTKFSDSTSVDTSASNFILSIPYAKLYNMRFRYIDQTETNIRPEFDYRNFGFDSVFAYCHDLTFKTDSLELKLRTQKLRATEYRTRKQIQELNTSFVFTEKRMQFNNSYAHVGHSYINANVEFNYDSIDVLKNFNTDVNLKADLNNCHINIKDLGVFSNYLKQFNDNYVITGLLYGTVDNLKSKNLDACFGKSSYFKGSLHLRNLPDIDNLYLDCKAKNVLVNVVDLKQYLDKDVYAELMKFGYFSGKGRFQGFFTDFIADGSFNSKLGNLTTDVYLKLPSQNSPRREIEISGRLRTSQFKIGQLIDYPDLETISFNGELKGHGHNAIDANVHVNAKISNLKYKGYNYKNITTEADLSNRMFMGRLNIKDSNLTTTIDGTIDFRKEWKILNVKLDCQEAKLYNLKLGPTDKFPYLRTTANLNARILNEKEIEGSITTGKTYLRYPNNKEVYIDSIFASIEKNDLERVFTLNSNLIEGNIKGQFDFIGIQKTLFDLGQEIALKIQNKPKQIETYYSQKPKVSNPQSFTYAFEMKDLNQFFDIYTPGIYISPQASIKGSYILNEKNNDMTCQFITDTLFYKNYEIRNNELNFELSKNTFNNDLKINYQFYSETQNLNKVVPTQNIVILGNLNNDSMYIHTEIEQDSLANKLTLNNLVLFNDDYTEILFDSSYTTINKEKWSFDNRSKIKINENGDIFINQLSLGEDNQHIKVNGVIAQNKSEELIVDINNFDINTLTSFFTNIPMNGLINGEVVASNMFDNPSINSELEIYQFEIDSILVGDIEGSSNYNAETDLIDLKYNLFQDYSNLATVEGFININNKNIKDDINVTVKLAESNLNILNPFLTGIIDNIEGEAIGEIKLNGKFNDIAIHGDAYVTNGKFRVTYLGTTYSFNDKISFNKNLIGFKNVKMYDKNNNVCIVNGGIYHDFFQKYIFDLNGYMNKFMCLNTSEKDNNLFYGSAYATGNWEILGDDQNIKINGDAKMLKNSKIYIPMNSYSSVEQKEYIEFVKPTDLKKDTTNKNSLLSGLVVNLNMDIESGCYSEIIFDKQAGDIIKCYGNGNMRLNVDTRGEFTMFGTLAIEKGTYNFTLANIINKEFDITNGSKITWTGNPLDGQLKINALHHLYASFIPFITDTTAQKSIDAKRRYPVDLVMDLDGDLLHPEILLNINILDKYPATLSNYVTAFRSLLANNPNELNRQVFSLILFRQFSPQDAFSAGGAAQNLNELLSNQLSTWLSQVDPNLQIQVDVTQLAQNSTNNFNMRFSYTLLDGRLRVSMDGILQNGQNSSGSSSSSQTSSSGVIGEWTVEYMLTEDGKTKLKLFNKASQNNIISNSNSNVNNTTGFSVTQTQEFDNVQELFKSKKKKKEEEEKKMQDIYNKKEEE